MDNDTLMIMCLVCKQIRDLIWTGQGMENKLVRIFKLSASKDKNDFGGGRYRVFRFISNMNRYFENVTKTRILQGFQHWKVQDVEEFADDRYDVHISNDELERLTQNICFTGIVSLDMSLPLPIKLHHCRTLHRAISFMVPNLQQLDLSLTTTINYPSMLKNFAVRCPRLEIIRWNCSTGIFAIDAGGDHLQSMNNLKELYLDNCYFRFDHEILIDGEEGINGDGDIDGDDDNGVTEFEAMADSNNHPNLFLFHRLCDKPLERISIGNARHRHPNAADNKHTVPQQILMKFVRNAPSTLVWFRSDLAATNIRILQSERPGIEFLN